MDELTQAIENTKQAIVKAINDSQLPVGIIEMILADFMNQIQIIKLQPKENESESE